MSSFLTELYFSIVEGPLEKKTACSAMSFPNDEFRSAFLSIIMEAQLGLGGRESF